MAIHGPYIARNNDASILNHMLKCNINDIKGFVKDNDIFVVDRGFRDSLTILPILFLYLNTVTVTAGTFEP